MTQNADALAALRCVQEAYANLNAIEGAVFLQVCADDGVSMHTLATRMALGQSSTMRHVTSLEGGGLVAVYVGTEDSLRKTVHLTNAGKDFKRGLFEKKGALAF
ncbi:MAG: hypothetical protein RIB43_10940 [Rhodospirillaceae bacterium]